MPLGITTFGPAGIVFVPLIFVTFGPAGIVAAVRCSVAQPEHRNNRDNIPAIASERRETSIELTPLNRLKGFDVVVARPVSALVDRSGSDLNKLLNALAFVRFRDEDTALRVHGEIMGAVELSRPMSGAAECTQDL